MGATPVIRHRFRNDRISVISVLSVSPQRRRLGLFWILSTDNIRRELVCLFLRHLLRHLRGNVVAQLSRATGGVVTAASTHRQYAQEVPRLGHGVFTWSLIEALSAKAAKPDGRITAGGIKAFVEEAIPAAARTYRGTEPRVLCVTRASARSGGYRSGSV